MRFSNAALWVAIFLANVSFADEGLNIAVASNFHRTAKEIAHEFTDATQIHVRISAGSTGKLYAQIVNGAPYDVFLAADVARPKRLEDNGTAVRGSRISYARGALVLWSADSALQHRDCRETLHSGSYRRLAIANPATAPYGSAAKQFLRASGALQVAQDRIVFGENISQTLQFVLTGNATLGLIAKSQVVGGLSLRASCSWDVPSRLHAAIDQQAVLLRASSNITAAKRFLSFLKTPKVEAILTAHGYRVPK